MTSIRKRIKMGKKPHVLALPYPAQGHVIPLMELSQWLVKLGFKVTFVNSDFNHKRVVNALSAKDDIGGQIRLVSIPDGLEAWEDRNDLGKLTKAILRVMPGKLEELIEEINGSDDEITCVIADGNLGWAMGVAEKMGIKRAAFWPAAAALLSLIFSVRKLVDDGILTNEGETLCLKKIPPTPFQVKKNIFASIIFFFLWATRSG